MKKYLSILLVAWVPLSSMANSDSPSATPLTGESDSKRVEYRAVLDLKNLDLDELRAVVPLIVNASCRQLEQAATATLQFYQDALTPALNHFLRKIPRKKVGELESEMQGYRRADGSTPTAEERSAARKELAALVRGAIASDEKVLKDLESVGVKVGGFLEQEMWPTSTLKVSIALESGDRTPATFYLLHGLSLDYDRPVARVAYYRVNRVDPESGEEDLLRDGRADEYLERVLLPDQCKVLSTEEYRKGEWKQRLELMPQFPSVAMNRVKRGIGEVLLRVKPSDSTSSSTQGAQ